MRTSFIVESVLNGLRRNVTMTIALILNTAITLAFIGAAVLANQEISQFTHNYEGRLNVSVFACAIDDTRANCPAHPVFGGDGKQKVVDGQKQTSTAATAGELAALKAKLQADPAVQSGGVSFVSEQLQYQRAKENLPKSATENLEVGDLPASFTVKLKDIKRDYTSFVKRYADTAGVGQVNNQSSVIKTQLEVIDGFRLLSILIAIVVLIASVLLIANTIQVAAQQRRNETSIMRLVGASRWMTEAPFLLEAVIATVIGAVISVGMLFAGKGFVLDHVFGHQVKSGVIPNLSAGDIVVAGLIGLVAGIVISALTAFATLRLYVKL